MWDECLIFVQPAGMTKPKILGQQGRDMEPVLLCWHNSHETKDVIQGSGARSQRTTSFFPLLLAVCVGEKKSDFANTGIRKTARDNNCSCYPKRWTRGHSTFSDLSFHIFFWLSLPYLTTLPWILPIVLAVPTHELFFSVKKGPASFPWEGSAPLKLLIQFSIHMVSGTFSIIYSSTSWYVYVI